jgi:ubiquitin carboxyl-terminal hydrolase 10
MVTKEQDGDLSARHSASASPCSPAPRRECVPEDPARKKDTVIDYLLFMLRRRLEGGNGSDDSLELPAELQRYEKLIGAGIINTAKARYTKRGMKNDKNNCYVNVVIQSLLPCSALMQLLSNCKSDQSRPFYSSMVQLCKEFHSKRDQEALNVLLLLQVKEIISDWQSLGAQQDAGEFLSYMINGMHEECKWEAFPDANIGGDGSASADDGEVKQPTKAHEDSPIFRIFGGLIRSSVRSRKATADSVSLEPFYPLLLDISCDTVDSVFSALDLYCKTEEVNGGQATKRLQFKALPKVLIVNLKRFSYNKGMARKIKKPIRYDEKFTFDRSWLVDGVEQSEYLLTAVICHHGEAVAHGHYTAMVRYNTEWYVYDDTIVRPIDLAYAINQQMNAYILLYQCPGKVELMP